MTCRSKLETEKGGRSVGIENNYVMNPSPICCCPAGIKLISCCSIISSSKWHSLLEKEVCFFDVKYRGGVPHGAFIEKQNSKVQNNLHTGEIKRKSNKPDAYTTLQPERERGSKNNKLQGIKPKQNSSSISFFDAKGLQRGFLLKVPDPFVETSLDPIKNQPISDLPNFPGSYEESLHEERSS
jgi:hypothetical protein